MLRVVIPFYYLLSIRHSGEITVKVSFRNCFFSYFFNQSLWKERRNFVYILNDKNSSNDNNNDDDD